jgi:hypothetical protein
MTDDRYENNCTIARAVTERARQVNVIGHGPLESYNAEVEVMSGSDGQMALHVRRSHVRWDGKKWHSESIYVTLSAEAWAHIISAPLAVPAAA